MIRIGSERNVEGSVRRQLQAWSRKLHDLSGRNRLLYYRETGGSSAEIEYPEFHSLFNKLVERGQMLVLPLPHGAETANRLHAIQGVADAASDELREISEFLPDDVADASPHAEPEDDRRADEGTASQGLESDLAARGGPGRSSRRKPGRGLKPNEIQTNCPPARLARILYNLRYAARTIQEEQGINILYVTFGMLRWRELRSPSFSSAPLILVPVSLDRERPNLPYKLKMADGDIVVNPALQVKLQRDFGFELPEASNDLTGAQLRQLFDEVRAATQAFEGWQVNETATLGAFSFLSLLLIKDFEKHESLYGRHPLVRWLVGATPTENLSGEPPPLADQLDETVDPATVHQILDADSSQQEAIEAAKRGLSFILQGPPGTGKSQTIANLIAEFIMDGKKVLFVSQKLAALEVVHHRLAQRGLAEFCLEVHSHRMEKRKAVGQLMESLSADALRISDPDFEARQREIARLREELNTYVTEMHKPRPALGLSLYELYGRLSQVLDAPSLPIEVPSPETVTAGELAEMLSVARDLGGYEEILRSHADSPWKGYAGAHKSLEEREQLATLLRECGEAISVLHELVARALAAHGLKATQSLQEELELGQALMLFRSEILSPEYEGVILRFRARGLAEGRFLSIQYGSDAEKLQSLMRGELPPSTRDISVAMDALGGKVRQGRSRGTIATNPRSDDQAHFEFAQLLETIARGYAVARDLFGDDEMPEVLRHVYQQPALEAAEWFAEHADHTSEIPDWANFNELLQTARQRGMEDFVRKAIDATVAPEQLEAVFSRRFYQVLIDRLIAGVPSLQRFNARSHAERIKRFRELDLAIIRDTARAIRAKLYQKKPARSWMTAASAATSILRREYNKKRRLKPLRRLFAEIPDLIQTLKPCLMMSPLTVCQLLDPALYQFDLVVFDEASQIQPEYAVSSFLRARQAVIAGDPQQLPPTNFFQTMEGEEPEEEPAGENEEFESILTLCDSRGFPSKMLNWHYRSKDESLIAYSNHHFYDGRLYTFPNSSLENPTTGLKFVYVDDGIYHPGEGARFNPREAERVAELAVEHMLNRPDLSLGIVAFSAPQRRAIETAMEKLRHRFDGAGSAFGAKSPEPLFVKNLENVQGDERDVIILSVGYGRDANGRFAMNFGPLNRDGGARRLNVAVTRARVLLFLVASIQPEEIDLNRAGSRGAFLLQDYLRTARDGLTSLERVESDDPGWESPAVFEEVVYRELTSRGLELQRRVGASEYRIDLAVRDPGEEHRFLLGLECDGVMYRSGTTARDRDRLRQQVLEGLGWNIHRIWAPEWVKNRDAAVGRILQLVETLREEAPSPDPQPARPPILPKAAAEPPGEIPGTQFPAVAESYDMPSAAEVNTPGKGKHALLAAPLSTVIDSVQSLVNLEGPISTAGARRQLCRIWGTRQDHDTSAVLERAITAGLKQGAFRANGTFLWPVGRHVAPLRVHSGAGPRRAAEEISPQEIAAAMRECIKAAVSLNDQDLVREAAKLFGLKVTDKNKAEFEHVLRQLLSERILSTAGGKITRGDEFDNRSAFRAA